MARSCGDLSLQQLLHDSALDAQDGTAVEMAELKSSSNASAKILLGDKLLGIDQVGSAGVHYMFP
jgi:hypothetical protein